jgi:large subunit ribosomal protein L5
MNKMKTLYTSELKRKCKISTVTKTYTKFQRLEKIVINCVTRDAVSNGKIVESISSDLAAISGQKPVITRAKNSIASFKLREGQALGAAVTLSGKNV